MMVPKALALLHVIFRVHMSKRECACACVLA